MHMSPRPTHNRATPPTDPHRPKTNCHTDHKKKSQHLLTTKTFPKQLEQHSEDDHFALKCETPLRILLKIDRLNRRAQQCMRPEHSADIARTLKNISDEVHHSQANNKEIKIHLIRMASVVTSTIQLEIQKAEELQHHQKSRTSKDNSSQSITESDKQSSACLLYTSPSPRDS